MYGGSFLGFFEGMKSTAVNDPSIAFEASKHCSTSNFDNSCTDH